MYQNPDVEQAHVLRQEKKVDTKVFLNASDRQWRPTMYYSTGSI